MSILDVISGKKPLFKSTQLQHWGDEIEFDLERAINAPFKGVGTEIVPALKGVYDTLAASRDYELAKRGGGDLQAVRQLIIPVSTTGEVKGSPFALGECTGVLLASRTAGDNGNEFESSDTARIYIQVNNSGVWIPLSFNLVAQGSQKGDAQYVSGPIATLRVQVVIPTQDPTNFPNMYLWLMRGFTVVGQFGAAVGYGPPTSAFAASQITPAPSGTGGGGGGQQGGGQQGGGQQGGGGHQGGGGGGRRENL